MPALLVSKSPPLSGEVTIHGAKNSVLPILASDASVAQRRVFC